MQEQELPGNYIIADNPTMSEPLQRPRASSMSESTRPGEMIEDWPTSSARLRRTRAVSFSEFSSLYSYEKATTPVNELFYTSRNASIFRSATLFRKLFVLEASYVKELKQVERTYQTWLSAAWKATRL